MICPFCKKEIPDHTQFCPECGQTVNSAESTGGASANYWNSVEKEAERDNKIRIDAESKIQEKKKAKKRTVIGALICVAAVAIVICYFMIIRPAQQYESALALFENGEFNDSLQIFESLGDYKDSTRQAELCRDNIREENYLAAINLYEAGIYSEAITAFRDLGDYQDSKEYIGECEVALINTSNTNEIVMLGVYNGVPIEWLVLSRDEASVLLISKYYVTSKIANESDRGEYGKYMCWSGSTLRTWLNNDFIDEAFPSNVADLLVTNTIQTDEYDVPNYDGWSEVEITVTTEDKVYIPSKSDVERYNLSPTSLMGSSGNTAITGWLRDRGHGIAFQVSYEPDGSYGSEWHFYSSYGIRPIIRLSLNGDAYTVLSDNNEVNAALTDESDEKVMNNETAINEISAPIEALEWNGHYYLVYSQSMEWNEANLYYQDLGGHLLTINSSGEQSFINSIISGKERNLYWIGLYLNSNNEWVWVNGEQLSYSNWGRDEPNGDFGGSENVVEMYLSNNWCLT